MGFRDDSEKSGGGKPSFRIRQVFYFALMLVALLAIFSYSAQDSAAIFGGVDSPPGNWIGRIGAFFAFTLFHLFGLAVYVGAALLIVKMIRLALPGGGRTLTLIGGAVMAVCGAMLLLALTPEPFAAVTSRLGLGRSGVAELGLSGGAIGQVLAAPAAPEFNLGEGFLRQYIGAVGTMILGWTLVTAGMLTIYFADWHSLVREHFQLPAPETATKPRRRYEMFEDESVEPAATHDDTEKTSPSRWERLTRLVSGAKGSGDTPAKTATPSPAATEDAEYFEDRHREETAVANTPAEPVSPPSAPLATPAAVPAPASAPVPAAGMPARTLPQVDTRVVEKGREVHASSSTYVLPPIQMLDKGTDVVGEGQEAIELARERLQQTLDSFGIAGRVTGYISGPRVTRFEITLDPGINVKKVEQIQDNIAMNLAATSIRVLAPIPGRPVVGVEISNSKPEAVFMRSVMESEAWSSGKAEIPIALGKDVSGKPVIIDLARAPHLLIAGATGTGKSVCTNSLIVSLLFSFRPDDLKLIMVDPKVVEFEDYRRLPHLLTPIINDSSKVPIALRWAVNEMDRRYRVLARAGVKKLSEFNSRPDTGEELFDDDGNPIPSKLPVLIVIIDELADLMMTEAKKDVENSITRIAQKGRAAGIHIVVATQRPSTNIITGVIKANLPTRICFQVRSMIDSRVVLDTNGAEKLLGMGDMLYMSSNSMNIERVQGALVKDKNIKSIVEFVCSQAEQHFDDRVLVEENSEEEIDDDELDDDAFDTADQSEVAPIVRKYLRPGDDDTVRRALEVVVIDRKVSTSYLQRRLKIGYNSAAKIIDLFEERGIVGPPSGSGNKREILIFDGLEINN